MRSTHAKLGLAAWLLVLAACFVSAIRGADGEEWLHSSIFELLPRAQQDPLAQRAMEAAEHQIARRLTFFVGHEREDAAMRIADEFAAHLADYELIESATARVDEERVSRFADFYFPYRQQLLSDNQIERISSDDGRSIAQAALAKLFSPLSVGVGSLSADPFLLFADSVVQLQPAGTALRFHDGRLWAAGNGKQHVLVTATTFAAAPTMHEQQGIARRVESAMNAATAGGAEVVGTGFLLFAHAGTESAKTEISVIGTGSVIGIVLLILAAFRSLRPLGIGLLSISGGYVLAFAVTLWIVGHVHLTTLVFGATLLGVAVDYTLHYFSHALFDGPEWTPERGMQRVLPGMTMALVTSAAAFLTLALGPFPGMKQLSIFAGAGLSGAYVTLVLSAPLLRKQIGPPGRGLLWCFGRGHFAAWGRVPTLHRAAMICCVCTVVGVGLFSIEFDDDISVLQDRPVNLIEQEERIAELLGTLPSNTFLVVRGATPEAVLQNEEAVRQQLDGLITEGALEGYRAVSQYVPSRSRQARSVAAYEALLEHHLDEHFEQLGVPDDTRMIAEEGLAAERNAILTIDRWLADPVSAELGMLWLGGDAGESASIVLLEGLRDPAAMRRSLEGDPAVMVIDKARDLSNLLGAYRVRTTWLLGGAIVVVLCVLSLRYGARRAVVLVLPPVLGALLALGAIGISGPLNLFHLLALVLVFGIGIDATLFLAEAARERLEPTAFAITLSALTTFLSFGLLSLSATHAVRSFGLTVLIGITCAYLLAPLVVPARRVEALPSGAAR